MGMERGEQCNGAKKHANGDGGNTPDGTARTAPAKQIFHDGEYAPVCRPGVPGLAAAGI
jgi:hypothetical protein